jgi:sialic acid synthase SpsE
MNTEINLEFREYSKKPLIIFELANNHNGSKQNAIFIIDEFKKIKSKYLDYFNFAIKLQYRDLQTYLNKDYCENNSLIERFKSAKLEKLEYSEIADYIKSSGFKLIITPFDEISVVNAINDKCDYIKIASACANDWPLLEQIVKFETPIIISSGGISLKDFSKTISLLEHRSKSFAILHCTVQYPTASNYLALDRISQLKNWFPNIMIGFSTHEKPDQFGNGGLAYAAGARIFEKHIGLDFENKEKNSYSADPSEVEAWLGEIINVQEKFNFLEDWEDSQQKTLKSLQRGIYARSQIKKGQLITKELVNYSFPAQENQFVSNDWSKLFDFESLKSIEVNTPLDISNVRKKYKNQDLQEWMNEIKNILRGNKVELPKEFKIEFTHHYGIENYKKFGMASITYFNHIYCKKLLILLAGQCNPKHFHKIKDESFICISGKVEVELNKKIFIIEPGESIRIPPGIDHKITNLYKASIIEEISTHHEPSDSYYIDEKIQSNFSRKSVLSLWSHELLQ